LGVALDKLHFIIKLDRGVDMQIEWQEVEEALKKYYGIDSVILLAKEGEREIVEYPTLVELY